ncbi:L-rhamnose mutarotase [Limnochorda pilosa]|uniref:L-rhamnose mutarotase n=1 Tax=Limnochorda pilosa TaxID=1555112 RepID=A0A0K2SH23_LIMPI|nr:L-rhamnose mutarotase [Limnochorda pilosa]BAS26416.1 L-rhamnose mutarotase [Limnochorda pilosa]
MQRYGFRMRLRNDAVRDEYVRLHRKIGQEVLDAHRRAGIRNYSIYLAGRDLFAYFEAEDPAASLERLAREPIMKEWWALTGPLMETDVSGRPVATTLPEAFHVD